MKGINGQSECSISRFLILLYGAGRHRLFLALSTLKFFLFTRFNSVCLLSKHGSVSLVKTLECFCTVGGVGKKRQVAYKECY